MPHINDAGLALVKSFESCVLTAYWDSIGEVWTIGWGHTGYVNGIPVHEGMEITQDTADDELRRDLSYAETAVADAVEIVLTPNQFSALVSFQYNTGAFKGSTMCALLNAGDIVGAVAQFDLWVHDGNGNVVPGLVNRRNAEKDLFLA